MRAGRIAIQAVYGLRTRRRRYFRERRVRDYLRLGRRPWSAGYEEYRTDFITAALNNQDLMTVFRNGQPLPLGYGYRLDARVVELPWLLSRLDTPRQVILDAGSSLNNAPVITQSHMARHKLFILTLAPEGEAYWKQGVSYVYDDLRHVPFRDAYFDCIACISTLEHVGMDTSMYTGQGGAATGRRDDYLTALRELRRVLKPGSWLYLTLPFGQYEDHGWLQQFDARRIDELLDAFAPTSHRETIFQYAPEGWIISDRAACAACSYFDIHKTRYLDPTSPLDMPPDSPAAERAVICLELQRSGGA